MTTKNRQISLLFTIFDKVAKEYGNIIETRNFATAERYFDKFIQESKLNPQEFSIVCVADIERIIELDENDNALSGLINVSKVYESSTEEV